MQQVRIVNKQSEVGRLTASLLFALALCSQAFAEPVTYSYDSLNRLTQANYGNGRAVVDYTYDAAGNRLTKTVTASAADLVAPSLTITSPANGTITTTGSITVAGTASDSGLGDSGIAAVTINGLPATGDTASGAGTANWSLSIPLSSGANLISVTATDGSANANQTTQNITVTYTSPVVDTDGDGIPDDVDLDDDNDGMSDKYELAHGLNPLINDANGDLDSDGFTNGQEHATGTGPASNASKPEGANGMAYVLFRDHFNDSQYDDRWSLQPVAGDTVYSLTESGTLLQGTMQRPVDQCRAVELRSFATVSDINAVYHAKVRVESGGATALGLMKDSDPNNRIEVRFMEQAPYLRIHSWDGGLLNDVPVVQSTNHSGTDVDVRLIKTAANYTIYLNRVFQGGLINNGLGDTNLRPTLLEESCATDSANVDSRFDLTELLLDRDGDGLADISEDKNMNGAVDTGESDPLNPDADGDGVKDGIDNCTLAPNSNQRDTNNDGYGNVCDPDLNNDGVVNFADLATMKTVFFANNADADLSGDGVVNFGDLAILKTFFFKAPGPSGLAP